MFNKAYEWLITVINITLRYILFIFYYLLFDTPIFFKLFFFSNSSGLNVEYSFLLAWFLIFNLSCFFSLPALVVVGYYGNNLLFIIKFSMVSHLFHNMLLIV